MNWKFVWKIHTELTICGRMVFGDLFWRFYDWSFVLWLLQMWRPLIVSNSTRNRKKQWNCSRWKWNVTRSTRFDNMQQEVFIRKMNVTVSIFFAQNNLSVNCIEIVALYDGNKISFFFVLLCVELSKLGRHLCFWIVENCLHLANSVSSFDNFFGVFKMNVFPFCGMSQKIQWWSSLFALMLKIFRNL